MRLIASKAKPVRLWLVVALCLSFVPSLLLADDESKTGSSNEQPKKLEASKPGLTERERWLLEKVEELEKRVAELEARSESLTTARPSILPAPASGAAMSSNADPAPGAGAPEMGTSVPPASASAAVPRY